MHVIRNFTTGFRHDDNVTIWLPRAGKKAKEAVRNATVFATIISSVIIGTIALIGTIWSPWSSPIQDVQQRLSKMEGRLGSLGGQITLDSVEKRLSNIEKELGTRPE